MGLPGSGKSTVAAIFAAEGCGVVDADALARAALDEPAVRGELVAWWGDEILDAGGNIDRKAVGRIVFGNEKQLRRLESLVHPRVAAGRRRLRETYLDDPMVRAVVEDCPLLLETGLDAECDVLILVDAAYDVRLERVRASRGWDAAELDRREKAQLPLDTKRKRADHCIDNSHSPDAAAAEARQILEACCPPLCSPVDPDAP